MDLKSKIDQNKLPKHVAVIMDGNGRWAKKHGKPRIFGHKNGVQSVSATTEAAAEIGIKYLTLYAFSTENWKRPESEVNALMELLVETIRLEVPTLNSNQIRLCAIGDIEKLPERSYNALIEAMEATSQNSRMTLVIALNYSSKWEIAEATKKIAARVKNGDLNIDDIDSNTVSDSLNTKGIPDPELLIRTSGEQRISNFLLWQIAYSELYFVEKFWPDFKKDDFYKAILEFQKRERRFGGI